MRATYGLAIVALLSVRAWGQRAEAAEPVPAAPVRTPAPAAPPNLAAPVPAAPGLSAKPKAALRLAVPDVAVTGELPKRQVALLEVALLAELRKLEGVSAIGMNEIRQMLSFEYQRQMLGCAADGACLAEIGGALGTDEMVHAQVIVEGKTATFSLRRISMRAARVVGTHTKRLTRANGEELLGDVGPAVQEVFPERPLRAGAVRGVDKAIALRLNPPPLPRWPFYVTASAAVAAAAAGATMGYLSLDAQNQWKSLAQQAVTEPVPGAQLNDLEHTAESRAQTANVLYLVAGGLAVAAGVEALFTDWHGYRAQVDVTSAGAAVKVGGSF
jgi:hypothetical protein